MLDTETKRKIDTARDILVGIVPDPKSQVEQITIALIYKFMSDMDREAVDIFKGKAKFFTGKFAEYDWTQLFKPSLGGAEVVKLYADAIENMNTNPNIPQLFREIFKNAYLPYKNSETLKLFLKTINEFTYEHSERLGDAYEYLLSVLGTQGDAGQFRTPRHIIDFIVECIEPKKQDTICDPACGSAGFVISSYKHILAGNTDKKRGDKLTPDDRKRLANSLYGYDLDPNMVRFALVNMYLHGFASPHIYEYDTLSSEERWNERYDIILANPPFMTPKGGIRPHKRFSIQAKRSEVLFTDYIHEHILPNGRGGVIVPNGIIATTQTAYKQLREMLVKESLIAVVSLPAGVFSPYSGVKTSILLLDKKLAKQTDKILFVKVENDGFDLGAQRREIDRNDLPNATSLILAFKQMLRKEITENKLAKLMEKTKLGALVEKEIILANKDVVLSAERYIESNSGFVTNIPIVKLEEIATFEYGYTASARDEGEARFIRITDIDKHYRLKEDESKYIDLNKDNKKYLVKVGDILIARTGATYGKTVLIENDIKGIFASYLIRMKFNHSVLLPKLFWYFTQTDYYWNQAKNLVSGGGQPQFNSNVIKEIQIPLPPMEVQKAIVTEIESYQKIIDGARQVVENYKPRITINPKWKMVELGNVVNKVSDLIEPQKNKGTVSYIGLENIGQGNGKLSTNELSKTDYQNIKSTKIVFKKNDILYGKLRPNLNKVWLAEFDGICSTDIFVLRSNTKVINPNYLSISLLSDEFNKIVLNGIKGAQLPRVAFDYFETLTIPLPDLKVQEKIVDETKIELAAVESNKTLIEMFEGKIKSKIAEVWGEL